MWTEVPELQRGKSQEDGREDHSLEKEAPPTSLSKSKEERGGQCVCREHAVRERWQETRV